MAATTKLVITIATVFTSCYVKQTNACIHGDIRLVAGDHNFEGNVEFCNKNAWGGVCRNEWDLNNAVVVCRQLGFADNATGVVPIWYAAYPPFGALPISEPTLWLSPLNCDGSETRLLDCPAFEIGIGGCEVYSVVSVDCVGQACIDGDIRLYGGLAKTEGIVEVCVNNVWGTVCDDGWDYSDASVVCKQLGFFKYGAVTLGEIESFEVRPDEIQIKIWLDELACSGNESNLIECPANEPGDHDCQHWEDAKVKCLYLSIGDSEQVGCNHGDVRLAKGADEFSGYVEVCVNNVWGMVCNHDWDEEESTVVCRQLGFSEIFAKYSDFAFGPQYDPMWLNNLHCIGNEASLLDCNAEGYLRVLNCIYDFSSPVGISCETCNQGDIRLTGGENDFEGRVEICYNNVWGTVCDNTWDDADASVVCRQLGLVRNEKKLAQFGAGAGPIWMDYVNCNGNELKLIDCNSRIVFGYYETDCYHISDAGVYCSAITTTESDMNHSITSIQSSEQTIVQTSVGATTDFDGVTTGVSFVQSESVSVATLGGALGTIVALSLLLLTVAVLMVMLKWKKRRKIKRQRQQFLRKYTTCTTLPLPEPSNVDQNQLYADKQSKPLDIQEDIYEELNHYEELQGDNDKSMGPKHNPPSQERRVPTAKNEAYMDHQSILTKSQTKYNMDRVPVLADSTVDRSQCTDKAPAHAPLPAAKLALQHNLYADCDVDSVATCNTTSHCKHAEESNGIYEIESDAESDSEVPMNVGTTSLASAEDIDEDTLYTEEEMGIYI